MGLLEDILARAQWMPTSGGFPAPPPPPIDEAAEAASARETAGKKLALANRKRPPDPLTLAPDQESAGVQLAMDQAPAGTGVPFSTQAGMLAPPVNIPSPDQPVAPLPPPINVGPAPGDQTGPTDITSRGRGGAPANAPLPIIPPAQAAMPPVPTGGPEAGMFSGGLPSILDKIRTGLGDNSNTLLAIGAGLAGSPNWGQGISRAAAAAIPARAADIKQRTLLQGQTTGYQAMVDAGVPKNLAIAAMGNPAIMKSVTENYLGDRKGQLVKIGVDRYGNDIMGIFDPFTRTITKPKFAEDGAPAAARGGPVIPGQPGAGTDVSAAQRICADPMGAPTAENDVTGPDYLQRLKETDPAYARQVEQVINGDAAMPTGRQAQTPFGRKLRQDVLTVEPGASDSDFATRNQVRKSYAGGNDSKVTKSINTVLEHAARLEKSINDLDNFDTLPSVMNPARNLIKGEYDTKYQKARGAYQTDAANFAKELDFAVSGGRPTVSGTKHQMEGFDLSKPKSEQLEKLREGVELLKGRLDSHATGYAKGMRKSIEGIDFINPENRDFWRRLTADQSEPTGTPIPGVKSAPKAAAPAAAPPVAPPIAVNKQTGERLMFKDGKWQPLQPAL
jgi:hypothetical protein